MSYPLDDTIVAIATPPGPGGVGIVRLSGPRSLAILQAMTSREGASAPHFAPRLMRYGPLYAPDAKGGRDVLDRVLAVHMPGPTSFTGQDVAEIHCHGGPGILAAVVDAACALGARQAERGEFTYRAFVHGKMDLTQAEAVAEAIASPSRQGLRLAQAKLSGLLGSRIDSLRSRVDGLRARLTLVIDFPEDSGELDVDGFLAELAQIREETAGLLAGYRRARHWREGLPVVLAGRVNAGKSSLLNALLGRNRVIVSDVPGTTRDVIEEALDLDGLLVRLSDTAGLRSSADPVEREGVARARELAGESALVLLVTDASRPDADEDRKLAAEFAGNVLAVRNKVDLLDDAGRDRALSEDTWEGIPAVGVSARTGAGLDRLAARIRTMALAGCGDDGEPQAGDLAPNLRQSRLLQSALAEADALATDLTAGMPCDLLSVRLDAMAADLGEITGFAVTDEILGSIFSRFCIGK